MKKSLCSITVGFVMVAILFSGKIVWASPEPVKKLTRGVVNIVTFPVEIPRQVRAYWIKGAEKTPHIIVWLISGAVKGSVEGVKRVASGIVDIGTSFSNSQTDKALWVESENVFANWPVNPKSGR